MESVAETKVCTKCGTQKPLNQYHKDTSSKDGLTYACKACRINQKNIWCKENPDKTRKHKRDEYCRNRDSYLDYNRSSKRRERWFAWKLQRQFGITVERFEEMLDEQGGKCAICVNNLECGERSKQRLHIDHDHKTGKVRGLLCMRCNTGIGSLNEDTQVLASAIAYLERAASE